MTSSTIANIAGILSLTAGIILLIITIRIFLLYLKKKKLPGLFLTLSVLSWTLGDFSAVGIYFIAGSNIEAAIIFQKLVYLFVFLATMFTFLFAARIFFQTKRKYEIIYLSLGIISILLIMLLNSVEISEFPDGSGYPLLALSVYFGLIIIVYIVPTTISIMIVALKLSKRMTDQAYKQGFKIIALGQAMIITTFVIDTLATAFIDNPTLYGLFLYLTWIFPVFGGIFYDMGWRIPERKGKEQK